MPEENADTPKETEKNFKEAKPIDMPQKMPEEHPLASKVILRPVEDEMKSSYLDYAMSVIIGRALPDVRDGLKPVHRRIIFSMDLQGMQHSKPFKKCARIVGDVLGRYHPHGDSSVYDALVRMAQPFSLRYPLIKGQGNFGSIDGDSAAAMRYCITGDSLILTDNGIMPISDISDKKEDDINLNILSFEGTKKPAVKFFDSGTHPIIRLSTVLGYCIKGSHNHPLLCWTFDKKPRFEWKLLENIKEHDIVMLHRGNSFFSKKNLDLKFYKPNIRGNQFTLPAKMNKDLAFLLGALVSEGSFHQNKIIFNNSDMGYYNKVKTIIYDQFKGIQLYERKISGNCLELEIYHQNVVGFLKAIGLVQAKSDKKEIPFSVLRSSKPVVASFINALFEGDGSVVSKIDKRHQGKSIELTYNSKSVKLIDQLKVVLLNFGIVTTKPYIDKRSDCYKLIVSGAGSIRIFNDEIGFFSDRKKKALSDIDSVNSYRMSKTDHIPFIAAYLRNKYDAKVIHKLNFDRYNHLEKNITILCNLVDKEDGALLRMLLRRKYLFCEVEESRHLKEDNVYSVKVDSTSHSFIANGFINHNTEAKLEKISDELVADLDKDTVDFVDNFDGSLKEPVVLPTKLPNLLINGSSGIAVGMATNIPPHNIQEVCSAVIAALDRPDISVAELMEHIKGPDFPTGAIIAGKAGISHAYATGYGKIKIRSKTEIEDVKGKKCIIVTEIPYMINKAMLIEEIATAVNNKTIQGISDIRDESDREGMRIVIFLKKDANEEIVLNQLMKYSRMQVTFSINLLALADNAPKVMNLQEMIANFIRHRKQVVRRRTKFDLMKARDKAHILEGLVIALDSIDGVIALIRASKAVADAMDGLMHDYGLSEKQAKAILEMRLSRLTSLEQGKVRDDLKATIELIAELEAILASEARIKEIIKHELSEIISKYTDKRKTEIVDGGDDDDMDIEDLIEPEDVVITVTHSGYIKRTPATTYRAQKRGGKGIIGASTNAEDDIIEHLFIANTHDYILFFTDDGQVHWLKVWKIPEAGRYAAGKAIVNLLAIEKERKISAFVKIDKFDDEHFLLMATKKGIIKKTELSAYSRPRAGGIKGIVLDDDDCLINVIKTDGKQQILLATMKGAAVKFHEDDARSIGRVARGVKGIRLRQGDEVVGMTRADDEKTLLTITENGYGKRTHIADYRLIARGGLGVRNIICSERNGHVVAVMSVTSDDEVMFISKNGIIIRTPAQGISVIGRNTQGVRLMKLSDEDLVVAATKIASANEDECQDVC